MAQRDFDLTIDPRVAFRIAELAQEYAAREYAAEIDEDRPDTDLGDDPLADENMLLQSDEPPVDSVGQELEGMIEALSLDARRDLLALIWLGRGNDTARDWHVIRREAADVLNLHVGDYLEQTPLASEWILEGLSVLGYDDES